MSAGGGSSLEKNKQNVAFLLLIIFLKFSAEAQNPTYSYFILPLHSLKIKAPSLFTSCPHELLGYDCHHLLIGSTLPLPSLRGSIYVVTHLFNSPAFNRNGKYFTVEPTYRKTCIREKYFYFLISQKRSIKLCFAYKMTIYINNSFSILRVHCTSISPGGPFLLYRVPFNSPQHHFHCLCLFTDTHRLI